MKKLLLLGILFLGASLHAAEMRPQFRVWKSSQLGVGNIDLVMLTSATIIFHMVVGSATVNNGGNSYFVMLQTTGDVIRSDVSTRAFVPLDLSPTNISGIGVPFDVIVTSHAFISKQGGANVGYLWDWEGARPEYLLPYIRD